MVVRMSRTEMERFAVKWASAVTRGGSFAELVGEEIDASPFEARAAAVRERLGAVEVTVDEVVCEGDRVAWRWTLRAGATTMKGANFQRVVGGRLVEHWTLIGQDG